jgi:hypothetical protein
MDARSQAELESWLEKVAQVHETVSGLADGTFMHSKTRSACAFERISHEDPEGAEKRRRETGGFRD